MTDEEGAGPQPAPSIYSLTLKELTMYDDPLYDDVHKWTYVDPKKLDFLMLRRRQNLVSGIDIHQRNIRQQIRGAHRFVLSDDYVKLAYETSLDLRKVPTWINLARLPYPHVWIEWDQHVKVRMAAMLGHTVGEFDPDLVSQRGGMLLQEIDADSGAWIASRWEGRLNVKGGEAFCSPVGWLVAPEGNAVMRFQPPAGVTPLRKRFDFAQGFKQSGMVVDFDALVEAAAFGFLSPLPGGDGAPYVDFIKNRVVTILDRTGEVLLHNAEQVLPKDLYEKFADDYQTSVKISMQEDMGLLRFVTTVLGMINNAPREFKAVTRKGSTTMGMHQLKYLGHATVHITIPKSKGVRFISKLLDKASAERRKLRAHNFRGHWRNVEYGKGERGCDHFPTMVENGIGICTRCERMIRWIPSGTRGDPQLGWVHHDQYIVEARE